jgi:hypothetical protein
MPSQGASRRVPGRIGEFVILDKIGAGGMGQVFRAHPEGSPEHLVALKLGPPEAASNPRKLERFRREGEITASLRHPNIVPVHSAGLSPDGRPFLAYHLIEGAQTYDQARASWDLRETVSALRDVARALGFAHLRRIVHRDVKPDNVLVSADGAVLLADFGLANTQSLDRITRSQVLLGTPLYMAPEIATQGTRGTCPQSDVYALGVMLHEALTGQHPFSDKGMQAVVNPTLRAIAQPVGPDVPAPLARIAMRALELDPARRHADGDALADALDAWLEGRALADSRPRRVGLALGALGLTALAALGLWWAREPAPAQTVTPETASSASLQPAAPSPEPSPTRPPWTPAQERALDQALERLAGDVEALAKSADARLPAELTLLAGAFSHDDPRGHALADGVVRVLESPHVDWGAWGLPVLEGLAASGARPGARRPAEKLAEYIYWGTQYQTRTFDYDDGQRGLLQLVRLDLDLDGAHHFFKTLPARPTQGDPAWRYMLLRVRARNTELPDGDPTFQDLLALADDPSLGPVTRARARAWGARAELDPTRRLELTRQAVAADPQSCHLPVVHVHALLYAGRLEEGLAALEPAEQGWSLGYGQRDSALKEEAKLLQQTLRHLLAHGLLDEARATLERFRVDYLPARPPDVVRFQRWLKRYVERGAEEVVVSHWLKTGAWNPRLDPEWVPPGGQRREKRARRR